MKTVGIIGGLSAESTILYYQGIVEGVRSRKGNHHAGHILIDSLDFGTFVALKERNDWDTQAELLCEAAVGLEKAGANFIVLATNTMHKMANQIESAISIPFLNLADATAQEILAQKLSKVALLGTRYTMELDFYRGRLQDQGIEVLMPDETGRKDVHDIIYDELCHGIVKDESRKVYQNFISQMAADGAQGVILGCTEIGMLVKDADVDISVFDTTDIHIQAALKYMLGE